MKSVDNARQWRELFSRHDVVELLAARPDFDWAKFVTFRHHTYALKFQFKPMRMIWVDIPQPNGYMQKTLIWYMVYSVTNEKVAERSYDAKFNVETEDGMLKVRFDDGESPPPYGWMEPELQPDGTYQAKSTNDSIRFIPSFRLDTRETVEDDSIVNALRPDELIPIALGPIRLREDPNRTFLNTVEMCREIAEGETVWGIVTWKGALRSKAVDPQAEGVDPRTDRFTVYIEGLTNAYRWSDEKDGYKAGDPIGTGRILARKTLKLNFWRPGDEYLQHEREIRYGIPARLSADPDRRELDYEWVYQ